MNRHTHVIRPALVLSLMLVAAATVLSAHGAVSPGYVYDASGKNVRDSSGKCVLTSSWNKDNATKECHPELFPEPKVAEPAPAPKPAPKPKVMVFDAAALFAFDKSDLTPAGKEKIKEYREEARAEMSSARTVKITGHTDNVGTPDYNQQLSLRRAEAVRDYLISIGGDASRMEVAGMGETQPLADNGTAEGRARNRRVEVEVIGHGK